MSEEAYIIGEIPADDLRMLEDDYQKGLKALLVRRGINVEDFQGKVVRLLPGRNNSVYYVMAIDPPPTLPAAPPTEEF